MKLAIVYDPKFPKLRADAYSLSYRDQFLALCERFEEVQYITEDFNANDVDADVIIFYDVHSAHHITVANVAQHNAVKYEYFTDPYQEEVKGKYGDGTPVHKLGPKQRSERVMQRGVDYIICPYTNLYWQYIAPHLDEPKKRLVWFPVAPARKLEKIPPLAERKQQVLANGATWRIGLGDFPYHFRRWAFSQECVTYVPHAAIDETVAKGDSFQSMLASYAGALALCDTHNVPKYQEIPLAGCVCFAQQNMDYEKMGFSDGVNCVIVNRSNFNKKVTDFLADVESYQQIADAGRKLVEEHWTAKHFAEFIHCHASRH